MTTGHTPGPWEVYPNPMREDGAFVGTAEHILERTMYLNGPTHRKRPKVILVGTQVSHADACLIAAAPDMLSALVQMVEEKADYMRINNLGDPETQHTIKVARAAIAKATNHPSTGESGS